ncbi:hypothetical protein PR048_031528 [Dryococelus australis]|uniref:Uncharacterized protein n=1 Tax=Dryococelus australis TaxID=614101 RepID=A0ABQ9G5I8_9NEOP|nr:hypothetical protein PR048_031528 [Dryococelus australis]
MERRRNEGARETGDPRENPLTNGIVWHDSHLRKSEEPAGPVHTRDSDICSLAADLHSSQCYCIPGSMALATCFPCKSPIDSESSRACLMNCDPIEKGIYELKRSVRGDAGRRTGVPRESKPAKETSVMLHACEKSRLASTGNPTRNAMKAFVTVPLWPTWWRRETSISRKGALGEITYASFNYSEHVLNFACASNHSDLWGGERERERAREIETLKIREFNDLQARLYRLMNKKCRYELHIGCLLSQWKATIGHRSPGGIKHLGSSTGMKRGGKWEIPEKNPSTSGIVRHDSHLQKSGVNQPEIEPWWDSISLTAQTSALCLVAMAYLMREVVFLLSLLRFLATNEEKRFSKNQLSEFFELAVYNIIYRPSIVIGITVAERLTRSPPIKADRVQFPAESPIFAKGNRAGRFGFSRGSSISPAPSFRRRSIFTSITLIGSQDLAGYGYDGAAGAVKTVPDQKKKKKETKQNSVHQEEAVGTAMALPLRGVWGGHARPDVAKLTKFGPDPK